MRISLIASGSVVDEEAAEAAERAEIAAFLPAAFLPTVPTLEAEVAADDEPAVALDEEEADAAGEVLP